MESRDPVTACTGLPADNPLLTVLLPEPVIQMALDVIRESKLINVDQIEIALDFLNREVAKERSKMIKS